MKSVAIGVFIQFVLAATLLLAAGCPTSRQDIKDNFNGKPAGKPLEDVMDNWPYKIPDKCWEEYDRLLVAYVNDKQIEELCWRHVNGCYIRVQDCGWGQPAGCGNSSPVLVIRKGANAPCSLEQHEAIHWLLNCSIKPIHHGHEAFDLVKTKKCEQLGIEEFRDEEYYSYRMSVGN